MRHSTSLFTNDLETVISYDKKVKDMQASGLVGKDWEGQINGKSVKLYLAPDVREQYKAVTLAESFCFIKAETESDKVIDLKFKLWDIAKRNSLIDGKEGSSYLDNSFEIDFIEQVIVVYLGELLLPLYHKSSTKVRDLMISNLKPYTNE